MRLFPKNPLGRQPGTRLIIGFATIIFLGAILLFLPISHQADKTISLVDSFFISFSAVCVTGLAPLDIGGTLSVFGSVVLAILIQLGGIGFASFALFFIMMITNNVSFSNTQLARESLNSLPGFDIKYLVRTVIITSLSCEIIGTYLSYLVFRDYYPFSQALGISIFHSISSFNNAGFDLLGNFQGLVPYQNNILLNLTTSFLIIIGGLGFFVIYDLASTRFKKNKKLRFHTKIVLSMTSTLLILGTIGFYFSEGNITLMQAFFQSVTARTAGFNTIDISSIHNASIIMMIVLMFIGASPGSTGGGIKTTTTFTILLAIYRIPQHKPVKAFYRKIEDESIIKAFMVSTFAILAVLTASGIIFSIEGTNFSFVEVLFECVSAFATVGLSMGITTALSASSKIFIMMLMFIGRLGPLTIAFSWKRYNKRIEYVEENILIG
jgi:trk system potassium uptake protein TrkH